MSAEVESMFSVREVPWHGLGTIVQEAPTSLDALKLAGLDWDVVQEPSCRPSGIIVPGEYHNIRTSDDSVLGTVSSRYKIVQNTEAFEFTDSLIGGDVKYETAGSLKNGHRVWLLAKLPTEKILGDDIDQYICFTNTHDASGAVKVCCTPVRVVCNNTLNAALSAARRTWSFRHNGDISAKLQQAKETLGLADSYIIELRKESEKLAAQKLSDDDVNKFLTTLFPLDENATDRTKDNVEYNRSQLIKCYNADDLANFKGTKYGMFNAVADFVDHVQPVRVTNTYQENNFMKIIDGHPVFDQAFTILKAI